MSKVIMFFLLLCFLKFCICSWNCLHEFFFFNLTLLWRYNGGNLLFCHLADVTNEQLFLHSLRAFKVLFREFFFFNFHQLMFFFIGVEVRGALYGTITEIFTFCFLLINIFMIFLFNFLSFCLCVYI